jgi:hypothetical protein
MYEFETFVYLDVQKTASTFIGSVLERYCTENVVKKVRHGGLKKNFDRSKLNFISVRDPLDQYLSLYSFGCTGQGQLFSLMWERGQSELYDCSWRGFEYWLEYVLDPANEILMDRGYQAAAPWIGFQSYRMLRLCVPNYVAASKNRQSRKEFRQLFEEANVVHFVIRYETLRDDLCDLLENLLDYCTRLPEALEFIRNSPPINASDRIAEEADSARLRPRVRRLLERREWLLGDLFW